MGFSEGMGRSEGGSALCEGSGGFVRETLREALRGIVWGGRDHFVWGFWGVFLFFLGRFWIILRGAFGGRKSMLFEGGIWGF